MPAMSPSPLPNRVVEGSLESVASLDIEDLIAKTKSERYSVLATTLSFSSSSSLYSLGEIPSFTTTTSARSASVRFTTMSILSTADPRSSWMFKPAIIIPTPSRVKSMLMEPICVDKWAERTGLNPPPGHRPWEDATSESDAFPRPPWVPEGSLFPPEALRAILRHRRSILPGASINDDSGVLAEMLYPSNDVSSNSISECSDLRSSAGVDQPQVLRTEVTTVIDRVPDAAPVDMPCIMVSTSTAVVPISLESSQSLVQLTPLALRRGHALPAPLNLCPSSALTRKVQKTLKSDLYPGIPTPFLGSPSDCTPNLDYTPDEADVTLDLDTMCGNLRSLCPPLRTPDFFPPLPPLPLTDVSATNESDVSVPEIPAIDSGSDDWAVVNEFLSEVVNHPRISEGQALDAETDTKPLTPIQKASSVGVLNTSDQSVSWGNSPTLGEDSGNESTTEAEVAKSTIVDSSRQQRRKTVIIETMDSTDRRRTCLTLDLSDVGKQDATADAEADEPQAIPWEASPQSHFSFSPSALAQSTPHSRPASSATLRPPARGILKAQKNVRFSIIPSMHEYEDDASEDPISPTLEHKRSPTPPPGGRRSSRVLSTSIQNDLSTPGAVTDKSNRMSFPKHPVARSMARQSKLASPPTSPTMPTPVLVAPKSPDTPGRRKPLHTRQSLPTSPTSSSPTRHSIGALQEGTGKPKRFRAVLSMPPTVQENARSRRSTVGTAEMGQEEDAAHRGLRSSITVGKAGVQNRSARNSKAMKVGVKMHVPFRSMWTKLRA